MRQDGQQTNVNTCKVEKMDLPLSALLSIDETDRCCRSYTLDCGRFVAASQ
jgi:hypothetical protein